MHLEDIVFTYSIIQVENRNFTLLPSSRAANLNLLMLTTVSSEVDLYA